uniref:Uncharacterized protein n=1 Tax=Rhizophora mucronata TaxID=61149 RepID=A0A2P2NN83_RHIMU
MLVESYSIMTWISLDSVHGNNIFTKVGRRRHIVDLY